MSPNDFRQITLFDAESRLQVEWGCSRSTQTEPQAYNNRASIKTIFWQVVFTRLDCKVGKTKVLSLPTARPTKSLPKKISADRLLARPLRHQRNDDHQ